MGIGESYKIFEESLYFVIFWKSWLSLPFWMMSRLAGSRRGVY
jgi:hypothetical protein